MDQDAAASAARVFLDSELGKCWEALCEMQRESIIRNGKKSRKEEGKIQAWAELDGFDKCRLIIHRMAEAKTQKEQTEE